MPKLAQAPYKAGHRTFKWHDVDRGRPVWCDLWYPSADQSEERPMVYGLGGGATVPAGVVADLGVPFPLMVMSHGAYGSASAYAWLAEYLARNGVMVLGVSHFGESPVYGAETIDPSAATRLWLRPPDCTFALTQLLDNQELRGRVSPSRIGAIGHSSGGATAVALGGAVFDAVALSSYCRSSAASADRGCQYGQPPGPGSPPPPEAGRSYRDPRIKTIVAMDPAAGPGFSAATLAHVDVPVLVVGSTDNDFLPFERHAGHYAACLPNVSLVILRSGEGHFVYLNTCRADIAASGVPLCVDRQGVDRAAVHAALAPRILAFLNAD